MKTIKQIADSLGLDKQKVYRYIRKNHINEVHHEAGVMYYDEAAEILIRQHFEESVRVNESHQEAHQIASLVAVISILKTELDEINKLIYEQQQTINKLTDTLASAQRTTQAEQLLHADTKKIPLLPGAEPAKPAPPSVGLWGRIKNAIKG
jgi:hypothetical protein